MPISKVTIHQFLVLIAVVCLAPQILKASEQKVFLCMPAQLFDAGYGVEIVKDDDQKYFANIFQITIAGEKNISKQVVQKKMYESKMIEFLDIEEKDESQFELKVLMKDQVAEQVVKGKIQRLQGKCVAKYMQDLNCEVNKEAL